MNPFDSERNYKPNHSDPVELNDAELAALTDWTQELIAEYDLYPIIDGKIGESIRSDYRGRKGPSIILTKRTSDEILLQIYGMQEKYAKITMDEDLNIRKVNHSFKEDYRTRMLNWFSGISNSLRYFKEDGTLRWY